MANPKNLDLPFGWPGLSPRIPLALARVMIVAREETPSEIRYNWGGPVFRGDAATRTLLLVPTIRRLARWPQPVAGGDIKESE